MTIKRVSTILTALILSSSITSCGNKNNKSSTKPETIEPQTAALSTIAASKSGVTTSNDVQPMTSTTSSSIQQPESGIIKHSENERKEEGFYLEDYVSVNFKGFEHDSECEVIVDWNKLAEDLGNDITPEILEQVYRLSLHNTDDKALDRTKVDDLINGDEVTLHMSEATLQASFKQKYSKELKYIDENVWYFEDTPVIVSGLSSKSFLEKAENVDKAAVTALFDEKMSEIKNTTKNYSDQLINDYGANSIDSILDRDSIATDKTRNCKINDFKLDKLYLATRTTSSYNDAAVSSLPENMVFAIYKLNVERFESEEVFDMYYRTELSNLLYEDEMSISDDTVKVQFAGTADELIPDSEYWKIIEVK